MRTKFLWGTKRTENSYHNEENRGMWGNVGRDGRGAILLPLQIVEGECPQGFPIPYNHAYGY